MSLIQVQEDNYEDWKTFLFSGKEDLLKLANEYSKSAKSRTYKGVPRSFWNSENRVFLPKWNFSMPIVEKLTFGIPSSNLLYCSYESKDLEINPHDHVKYVYTNMLK